MWDSKELETAILAIDLPCPNDQVLADRFRVAFGRADAARPGTPRNALPARDLSRQLGQKVAKYPAQADLAARPIRPGGC